MDPIKYVSIKKQIVAYTGDYSNLLDFLIVFGMLGDFFFSIGAY